eukprot:TRINITY_DN30209_c0_g1_i2.p1 TRINITY_DN30209_c0_g1~~TRINITY_DN30209_c0_g1_i2.p1  ORF type:complete len:194 (+),score=25.68 TRINITY_DN30209_c0_g1_i2:128-709(+)
MSAREDCNVTYTPFDREEGRSWRYADEDDTKSLPRQPSSPGSAVSIAGSRARSSPFPSVIDAKGGDEENSPWLTGQQVERPRRWSPQVLCVLVLGLPLASALLSWRYSCWLMSLVGIAWICGPLCLWSASEIGKLWLYWDGRAALVEEWPALMMARTSVVALLFVAALGLSVFVGVAGAWGLQSWSKHGHCPV